MTAREAEVKSFLMLGNVPFGPGLIHEGTPFGQTNFIFNTRVKYEIGRVEFMFNQQTKPFEYIQGSTPSSMELDIGSLHTMISHINFGLPNTKLKVTFTTGPNGVQSQKWCTVNKTIVNEQSAISFIFGSTHFDVIGPVQLDLLTKQLNTALDMLVKGSIEYSVKKDHIAGKMQGGSNPPASPAPTQPGSTPPSIPGQVNNMNTAPEGMNIARPSGPTIDKAPANPSEIMPAIPPTRR